MAMPGSCSVCRAVLRPPKRIYCSDRCQSRAQDRRRPDRRARSARQNARKRTERIAAGWVPRPAPNGRRKASRLTIIDCRVCGKAYVKRYGNLFCSDECRRTDWNLKVSARVMGLYREAIAVREVKRSMFWHRQLCQYLSRRDGPHCAICNRVVDLTIPSGPRGLPIGPSVDHVVPMSKGGTDQLTNLRLTHWGCNRARGNRGGNEQLLLVG